MSANRVPKVNRIRVWGPKPVVGATSVKLALRPSLRYKLDCSLAKFPITIPQQSSLRKFAESIPIAPVAWPSRVKATPMVTP